MRSGINSFSRVPIEAEGTSTWTWGDSAGSHNIGRLQSVSGPGYGETYTYDVRGRLSIHDINVPGTYRFNYTYNGLGALETLTWPTSTQAEGAHLREVHTRLPRGRARPADADVGQSNRLAVAAG